MKRNRITLPLMILLLFFFPALSWSWQGKAVRVVEGDIFEVLHEGKTERIRLYGIAVPEKGQDFSKEAKKFTSERVLNKRVSIKPIEKDREGRTVAIVVCDRVNLNVELVRAGYAWVYDRYCTRPECKTWKFIEAKARDEQNGVWSLPNPVPPWELKQIRGINPTAS